MLLAAVMLMYVMEFLNSDPPEPPLHYCMQVQSIDVESTTSPQHAWI